jgi:transcriptional regulator with XRE-family HTH domain
MPHIYKDLKRETVRKVFAQCLRTQRKRQKIAQEDLAHAADVDRGYMSGLERGKHTPTLDIILRLLPPLGLTFPEFAAEFEQCLLRSTKRHRS